MPIEIGSKVVVTTSHRGVFFGTLTKRDGTNVTITDARNCVYWPTEVRGFVGLMTVGPLPGSRVGPAAPAMDVANVTCVGLCSDDAAKLWEAGPWS